MHTQEITCDSCGAVQSMSTLLAGEAEPFLCGEDLSPAALNTYKKALSMMASAKTEHSFMMAAELFDEIPNLLNAPLLAQECRDKADLFKKERLYGGALLNMQSDDPARIQLAIETFRGLGDYKEAPIKAEACIPLLKTAQIHHQKRLEEAQREQKRTEARRKQEAAKRKFWSRVIGFLLLITAALGIAGYFYLYSPNRIQITLSPAEENFLQENYGNYRFTYNVRIKNEGLLDVSSVTGTVLIENEGEVLVDTEIRFQSYSSSVARAHKSGRYTWELTVYSYDIAKELYEADHDDLDIEIKITEITYTNGKTKTF
jgi:hypothetical protein